MYKQFNGKLSQKKSNEICLYLQDLLISQSYPEIIQIITSQRIIDNLCGNKPTELNNAIFKTLVAYDDFIEFIGSRKPSMFFDVVLKFGVDKPYLADFIRHMLLNQEFLLEMKNKLDSSSNSVIETFLFYKIYDNKHIPLSIVCESSLLDLKNSEIINTLNNSQYYEESKLLSKYRIYSVTTLLGIRAEFQLLDGNTLLQYYKAFILEITKFPIKLNNKSHLHKISILLLSDFSSKLLMNIQNFENSTVIIADFLKILTDVLLIIANSKCLLVKQKREYLDLILRSVLKTNKKEQNSYRIEFNAIFSSSCNFQNNQALILIEEILNSHQFALTYNIDGNKYNLFKIYFKSQLQTFDEYNAQFTSIQKKDIIKRISHSEIADKIKNQILEKFELPDYLFYPFIFCNSDNIEDIINEEKRDFSKNSFDNYWSFIELYSVNIESDNNIIFKHIINNEKFQIPSSLNLMKKMHNLDEISQFETVMNTHKEIQNILNKNKEVVNENLSKIQLNSRTQYLFESQIENGYFIFCIKINFVHDYKRIMSGEIRTTPSSYVMIKIGVSFNPPNNIEIVLFNDAEKECVLLNT